MKHGKKYRASADLLGKAGAVKDLSEAVRLVKQTARAKFDETIVVSSHLGVDPRHADQLVRGTVVLPHGTGKSLRVLVLAKGRQAERSPRGGCRPRRCRGIREAHSGRLARHRCDRRDART
jgi:large subunit ribosomal protein L1